MAREGGSERGFRGDAIGSTAGLSKISPGGPARFVNVRRRQRGPGKSISQQPEPRVQERRRHHRMQHRFVVTGPGAHAAADSGDLPAKLPSGMALRGQEQQMLEEMSDPLLARRIIGRAHVNPGLNGDDGCGVVLLEDHVQTVVQLELGPRLKTAATGSLTLRSHRAHPNRRPFIWIGTTTGHQPRDQVQRRDDQSRSHGNA